LKEVALLSREIKVNGIYRKGSHTRLVLGIFNGKVLYVECKDEEPERICPVPSHNAHMLWRDLQKVLASQTSGDSFSVTSAWKYHLVLKKSFAKWAEEKVGVRDSPHYRFLQGCRLLVDRRGKSLTQGGLLYLEERTIGNRLLHDAPRGSIFVYADDEVAIATNNKNGALAVTLMKNQNPAVMVNESGIDYRFHGQWAWVGEHVERLVPEEAIDASVWSNDD